MVRVAELDMSNEFTAELMEAAGTERWTVRIYVRVVWLGSKTEKT